MNSLYRFLLDHEGSAMERPEVNERENSLRALIAEALAEEAAHDPSLARALAVHEEWRGGYIGRLVVTAELLATQRTNDFGVPEATLPVAEAMHRALENANPRGTLNGFNRPISDEARAAMVEMLRAQATFHRCAAGLDRRQLRRPDDEEDDINDLVNG